MHQRLSYICPWFLHRPSSVPRAPTCLKGPLGSASSVVPLVYVLNGIALSPTCPLVSWSALHPGLKCALSSVNSSNHCHSCLLIYALLLDLALTGVLESRSIWGSSWTTEKPIIAAMINLNSIIPQDPQELTKSRLLVLVVSSRSHDWYLKAVLFHVS